MLGNFDEITDMGFNVDEILRTYNQNKDESDDDYMPKTDA